MKKVLIFVGIILVLGGVTGGVLWVMKLPPFDVSDGSESSAGAENAEAPTTDGKKKSGSLLGRNAPVFYPLDPLVIPIFGDDGVSATVQVQVKLEVVGEENRAIVRRLKTKLSDALLRDLYGFLPRLIKSQGRLDVTILKQRMQMVVSRTVGPDVINDVLVQSVSDQAN